MNHDHSNHINDASNDMNEMTTMKSMTMSHMKMYFHFGSEEKILFDFWKTHNAFGIIWSSVVIILLCFVYESFKWGRTTLRRREIISSVPLPEGTPRQRQITPLMIVDSVLHGIQLILGYCLMLIFMTFNVWLCLATVFGEVVAHLFFRFLFPELDQTNSEIQTDTCCG